MSFGVTIANVLEAKVAVITDKPASKTKEELRERRVDIEIVLSENIIRGKLAEVDFVEPGTGRTLSDETRWTRISDTYTTWSGKLIL